MSPARRALQRGQACFLVAAVFSLPVVGPTAGDGTQAIVRWFLGCDGNLILDTSP